MSDSSSFSSLLELVDSHLSKCSVRETSSDKLGGAGTSSIQIPPFNFKQQSSSDTSLLYPENRLPIPRYDVSDSPIQKILAEQIANMLKAKERKEHEEKQRLEELKKSRQEKKQDEYVIDLMQAIQTPDMRQQPVKEVLSTSSSFESLLIENTKYFDDQCESPKRKKSIQNNEPEMLPCITDMSYILTQKLDKVKCSAFGKVLTARLKPVAAPYLKMNIKRNNVIRFDFSTKSPCDLIKEKLRQPTSYNTYMSPMDLIMKECGNT